MPIEQTAAAAAAGGTTTSSSPTKRDDANEENGALRVKLGDISLDCEKVKKHCTVKYFHTFITKGCCFAN